MRCTLYEVPADPGIRIIAVEIFDFEAAESAWKIHPTTASATLSIDDRVAKSGRRSLRLSHPE